VDEEMSRTYLITGGAGFIGANAANRLLHQGHEVIVYDNLSRPGANLNLSWLREQHGDKAFRLIVGDVRDPVVLTAAVQDADVVLHLAGQVAVTTSIRFPREDFESNALGTFNLLEAARLSRREPIILYASTNKVYGAMEDVGVVENESRYRYSKLVCGVPEGQALDLHSPYGCSKGCGDQYVRDYYRIYGLRGVVLRQSCIYGPRQLGMEDQGWVAWIMLAAVAGRPIKIYGNGKQVRDLLWIDDLLDSYDLVLSNIDRAAGRVYNIGGGPDNSISVWQEYGQLLAELLGHQIPVSFAAARPGDQKIYISDIRRAEKELGWYPTTSVIAGVQRLFEWIKAYQEELLSR
jgi:CDP-paratose 2-epimerase